MLKRMRIMHETGYPLQSACQIWSPSGDDAAPRGSRCAYRKSLDLVEPGTEVSWLRDTYDNSIAILTFQAASNKLALKAR
jgi:hypothetical protein